ncbi:hypothetical protein ACFOQM_06295 [Paenibacillus sp. GCM10012307]|uniref:Uncharacterized protein n=1 Tax=Paenibacillus roseus TaxID=2798579 RepID=A0A934MQ02_9BACL|nr:hypothetical protein [Paenibacillus roseus]MBJ6360909.1 hypothetical protein [Paenibacillus roseus]
MNNFNQGIAPINEENPALEEGMHFIIPAGQLTSDECLNALLQELGSYYEVKLCYKSTALKVTCLNAIERDPVSEFHSLLNYMSMRKQQIRTLLEKHGFSNSGISLYFSHNVYGNFSIAPLHNLKDADRRKVGRIIRKQ